MLGTVRGFLDQQRPHFFLWVPVILGSGIATYFSLRFEPVLPAMVVVPVLLATGIMAFRTHDDAMRIILFALMLFALGLSLASWRAHKVAAPVLTDEYFGAVEGRVAGIDRSASNRVRMTLDNVVLYGIEPDKTPTQVRISLSKSAPTDQAGQRILVYARLSGPNGPVEPDGFDFRRMAWFRELGAIGYALGPILPSLNFNSQDMSSRVLRLRMTMSHALQARIPGAAGGFASAILTGDRSAVDPASLTDLRSSNLAHLLAISGLHMGLLTGLIFVATRQTLSLFPRVALRVPVKKIGAIAALFAGLAYLILSGASVATQRAFVMATVIFIAVLVDRPAFTLRGIALAALIILVVRPESLTGAGFQMSFAATIGLVAAFDLLRRQNWWQPPRTLRGKFLRGVFVIAFTSAVAGLATAPISAFHFNQIAQYGLLANVLAVPVMGFVIMPAAIIGIILSPLGLDGPAFWVTGQGISWVLAVAKWVAGLQDSLLLVSSGPNLALGLCALGGLILAIVIGRGRVSGLIVFSAGLVFWAGYERPDILIDPTARIAGIQTPSGRVLTRSRGAGYAASTWLENDGDGASQKTAARRLDAMTFEEKRAVLLSSGYWLQDDADRNCAGNTVFLVEKDQWPTGKCQVYDKGKTARTGSVAIWVSDNGLRTLTAVERIGSRLWTLQDQ